MDIRFLQPLWLAMLLIVPMLWFFPRRPEKRTQGILRTVLATFLIVALARPVWLTSNDKTYRVFVVDRSASVPIEQQRDAQVTLQNLRRQLPERDLVSVISLGADPAATATISGASASSIGGALQAAAQQIPDGSRGVITLISDGLATDRDWGTAVQSLGVRGIPIHTVKLSAPPGDVYPAALRTDPILRVGQTVQARVDVVGQSSGLVVRLTGPDGELARSAAVSSPGRIVVPLSFEAPEPGILRLTAEVVPGEGADTDASNNSLSRVLPIQEPLRILYIGDRQRSGSAQLAKLLGRGFEVTDAGSRKLDERFPLEDHELVFIDDRPANTLPMGFQQHLVDTVRREGMGLMFSGGKASFGTGGYYNALLSQALPVEITQREEKRDPSVSLAIIIDTSGSMAGPPLELAKQVAQLTIHRLTADDQVGIVEFYGAKQWAVPLQSAANRLEIDRAIGRMQAGGGTVLYPGIEEAYYGLKNMRTRHKHILVITDAGVEDADFEGMARRVAKDGINISTVLAGDGRYDEIMFNLASWGKGRYYAVADRFSLVELILKQISTRRLPSYRTGQFPLVSRGGAGWWGNIDRSELPPLSAYVELDARPRAEVLIEETSRSRPVLASWHYGLGRVTALMTEPLGAGTRSWQRWAEYGTLLGRIVSRTASDDELLRYQIERDATSVKVVARRNTTDARVRPAASLETSNTPLEFIERAPGLFEASLPAGTDEEIRIVAGLEGTGRTPPRRLVSIPGDVIAAEKQVDPESALDLERLARATGGQVLEAGMSLPEVDATQRSLVLTALWPWCLLMALMIYLAEIAYRRRARS